MCYLSTRTTPSSPKGLKWFLRMWCTTFYLVGSSFATALNIGYTFVPQVNDFFVESFKKYPILNVLGCLEGSSVPNDILLKKWIQEFVDKVQHQRRLEARYSDMMYVSPDDKSAERMPEIITLSLLERTDKPPEIISTLVERMLYILKKNVKSEPSEEDVRFFLRKDTTKTTHEKPEVGGFVMLFPNHHPKICLEPSEIVPITSYRGGILSQLGQLLPDQDKFDVPHFQQFVYLEPAEFDNDDMQEVAEKGHGAFLQAFWVEYGKAKLYLLARAAWEAHGRQMIPQWIKLSQTVRDSIYGDKWLNTIFEIPDKCTICLQTMHWAEKIAEKGYEAFSYLIWKDYGITKLYYLLLKAWNEHRLQHLDRWMPIAQNVMDSVDGSPPPSKHQSIVPSACKRCYGRELPCVDIPSTWIA
ncbi:hypothetical protein NPIL_273201 [Nephila pilipes]|uniref:Uncharacterized protein n=1 Tax=Nephila pilipes TaxID=299642 RepID=A0A8X6PXV9_NEPPI|nr:hypothetical protein NPIL_273201 [Nephila pilipes]